jgi:hypothetical protein
LGVELVFCFWHGFEGDLFVAVYYGENQLSFYQKTKNQIFVFCENAAEHQLNPITETSKIWEKVPKI